MVNNYEWYGKDMAKFPRFQEKKRDKKPINGDHFPGMLNAK